MSPQAISLMVGKDHAVPIQPYGGTATVTVGQTGGTVFYSDNPQVSASNNQGSIAPGAQAIFTRPQYLIANGFADVQVSIADVYAEWAAQAPGALEVVDICAEFGVSTGNSDNSVAINNALATLGPQGLTAFISKPGVYAIKNPIIIGNGTSSSFSTWSGMLMGAGMPGGTSAAANAAATVQTMIQWTGAAGQTDAMIQIIGPLSGWVLQNLRVDGGAAANAPAWAIHFKSTVRGRMDNVSVSGCQGGIWHDSYASVSGALSGIIVDDIFNQARNISIGYIGKSSATSVGLNFDGGATAVSNTCFNSYDGLWFSGPSTSFGGGTINCDLQFKRCDSITIRNSTFDGRAGSDTQRTVFFDYSAVQQWPKGILMDKCDFGSIVSSQISSTGTPGGSISHNRIINISSSNGQPGIPSVPWLQWGQGAYTGFVALVAGTATVASVSAVQAGSFIRLTTLLPGGTVGHCYVSARSTGSFTISSTSGADTSTILYEVLTDPFF